MPSIYALQYPTAFSKRMLQSPLPREMQVAHLSTVSPLPVKQNHTPKQTEVMVRLKRDTDKANEMFRELSIHTHTHVPVQSCTFRNLPCLSILSFCCSLLKCFSLSFTFSLSISLSLYKDDDSGSTTVFNLYKSIASS